MAESPEASDCKFELATSVSRLEEFICMLSDEENALALKNAGMLADLEDAKQLSLSSFPLSLLSAKFDTSPDTCKENEFIRVNYLKV